VYRYGEVLFNMYNVAEFLANEKFITWDSCHKVRGCTPCVTRSA
jgi:hypothetical protein